MSSLVHCFLKNLLGLVLPSKGYYFVKKREIIPTQTKIIEIIGAPGVGKTTLIKKLQQKGLIRQNRINKYFLGGTNNDSEQLQLSHVNLFKASVLSTKGRKKTLGRFQNLLFYLLADSYLNQKNEKPQLYLVDEGLGHHFTSALLDLFASNPESFKEIMGNRHFILLSSNPKTTVERIKQRKKLGGKVLPQHENIDCENLEDLLEQRQRSIISLLEVATNIGSDCLIIDAEKPHRENIKQIKEFLSHLAVRKIRGIK